MNAPDFANAKKMDDVLRAIEAFKRTIQLDDRFEQYKPSDNFSNFALHLAAMYKASDMSQTTIAGIFNQMYDLAQGKKAATLFEEADTTEYPLADIIKQVLGIEYKPAKNGNNNVTNGGADVALRNQDGQGGELRGKEPPSVREQDSTGAGTPERGRGAEGDSGEEEVDENGLPFVVAGNGTTSFGVIREESGLPGAPIKLSEGYQDENGKGYGLRHIEAGHGEEIRNAGFSSVEEFVSYVASNYDEDNIRVGKKRRNGNTTYLIQVTDSHDNTLLIELSKDGTFWNVNSGGVFRKGYSNKKETVAKTEPQQPNNAVSSGSSLSNDEQRGISSIEPNGEPTVSEHKVNNSTSEKQGDEVESSVQTSESNVERSVQGAVEAASAEVNTDPTPAQKEAGNYKKGHVTIGDFDITIENPAGSVRKGVDADGKEWQTTMANAYGYIRGTESVDGDHIDVFLHTDMDSWSGRKVYVVDQTGTDGGFDEHKVMLGFNDKDEAMDAYLANYDDRWAETHPGIRISETGVEDFTKWIQSSHRKTKPFADYSSIGKKTEDITPSATASAQSGISSGGTMAQTRFDRTVPATPEAQRNVISKIVEIAKKVRNRVERAVIAGITNRQIKDFAKQGIYIDGSWVHSFETSAIAHNQKHHGKARIEENRGQIAITEEDYARIPEILESYDIVSKSANKTKGSENEVLIYKKEFGDGFVYYLEEKRENRRSLSFHTMYKKKKGTDSSDGFAVDSTAPITPLATPDNLSSNSEYKINNSASEKQGDEVESSWATAPAQSGNPSGGATAQTRFDRTVPATPEAQRNVISKIVEIAKKVRNRVERI